MDDKLQGRILKDENMQTEIMRKHPAVGMRAVDLGELYTYLKLFERVYTDYETERQIIERGIEDIL